MLGGGEQDRHNKKNNKKNKIKGSALLELKYLMMHTFCWFRKSYFVPLSPDWTATFKVKIQL